MKKQKQIIFISNEVANGGAGRVISVLANAFVKEGYGVSIYSYHKSSETYPLDKLVKQYFLRVKYKSKLLNKVDRILQLRKEFKKNFGATIISFEYFVNMQTVIAGFGLKNRTIISERNDPAQQDSRKLIKHLRNILYGLADVLVCQTPEAKAYFPEFVQKKAVVIPNPIKEGLPKPFNGKRKKIIVNFGRLEKQKNLPLLIEAFALLYKEYPDYRLFLYGDGSAKKSIEALIAEKKLQDCVTLHGSTPDIHTKILDCAMYVSSSDYEGLSNSMLEAMALGLPCVVTDCPCGGAKMMIRSYENGILVPVKDVQSMYEAMKYLIENPKQAAYISHNATKIRMDLAAEKIASQWEWIL